MHQLRHLEQYLAHVRACHVRAKAREYAEAMASAPRLYPAGEADPGLCVDLSALASRARSGGLSPAEVECLHALLRESGDEEIQTRVVELLVEDAHAKGDAAVRELFERAAGALDCSDPRVYLEHERACDVLRRKALGDDADRP